MCLKDEANKPLGSRGTQRSAAGEAERTFVSQFLGGIAQSLGFPDVFGMKPPWEFGAFKLRAGLGNMGFSWANQIGNAMDGGQDGAPTGFGR